MCSYLADLNCNLRRTGNASCAHFCAFMSACFCVYLCGRVEGWDAVSFFHCEPVRCFAPDRNSSPLTIACVLDMQTHVLENTAGLWTPVVSAMNAPIVYASHVGNYIHSRLQLLKFFQGTQTTVGSMTLNFYLLCLLLYDFCMRCG